MRRALTAAHTGLGLLFLTRPNDGLRLLGYGPPSAAARRVAQVLGARHLAQATIESRAVQLGATVDGLHGATCLLYALASRHRRAGLTAAGIAFALAGAEARSS
jgi:hypothetical protein